MIFSIQVTPNEQQNTNNNLQLKDLIIANTIDQSLEHYAECYRIRIRQL
jgi:hypothetical protein